MPLPLNSVELFTGAGGLALGLEKVGCHHLAMVEFNPQACDTIRYNVRNGQSLAKNWTLYQSDVRAIKYDEIVRSVELVAGTNAGKVGRRGKNKSFANTYLCHQFLSAANTN